MPMPLAVTVTEVGPRDGLQNESAQISTADQIAFIDRLSTAGLREIEVSAFVSARRIPQLSDAAEVFAGITKRFGTRYSALVPNMEGYTRAIDAGVTEFAIFAAASETRFSFLIRRFRFLPAGAAVPPKPPNQVRSCSQERYAGPGGEQSPPWITKVKSHCQSSRQAGYPNNDSNQLRQQSRFAHGFLLSIVIWHRQDFCRSASRRFLERALSRKRGIACGKNYFRPAA